MSSHFISQLLIQYHRSSIGTPHLDSHIRSNQRFGLPHSKTDFSYFSSHSKPDESKIKEEEQLELYKEITSIYATTINKSYKLYNELCNNLSNIVYSGSITQKSELITWLHDTLNQLLAGSTNSTHYPSKQINRINHLFTLAVNLPTKSTQKLITLVQQPLILLLITLLYILEINNGIDTKPKHYVFPNEFTSFREITDFAAKQLKIETGYTIELITHIPTYTKGIVELNLADKQIYFLNNSQQKIKMPLSILGYDGPGNVNAIKSFLDDPKNNNLSKGLYTPINHKNLLLKDSYLSAHLLYNYSNHTIELFQTCKNSKLSQAITYIAVPTIIPK